MAEAGHAPNRTYNGRDGNIYLNGANLIDSGDAAIAQTVTFSPAAGSTNVCEVTVTIKDGAGAALARVHQFDIYLSDSSIGLGHTSVTASGAVAAKASSGTDVATQVSKKALTVQSLSTGVYILSITDSAKTAFRVCVRCPGTGRIIVSDALVTGNYG